MNWHRLLWSIPDEWLFLWALDKAIIVKDKTSNPRGGKIRRIFLPVAVDVLNNLLLGEETVNNQYREHFSAAVFALERDASLKTKFMFWRDKITSIRLSVEEEVIAKEPNTVYGLRKEKK
jgi:hypothetical protein